MSLEKPEVIDLIFLSPDKKKVSLVAYDGGEIPEPAKREQALQKKLHTYLEFVASGQFLKTYQTNRLVQYERWVKRGMP